MGNVTNREKAFRKDKMIDFLCSEYSPQSPEEELGLAVIVQTAYDIAFLSTTKSDYKSAVEFAEDEDNLFMSSFGMTTDDIYFLADQLKDGGEWLDS